MLSYLDLSSLAGHSTTHSNLHIITIEEGQKHLSLEKYAVPDAPLSVTEANNDNIYYGANNTLVEGRTAVGMCIAASDRRVYASDSLHYGWNNISNSEIYNNPNAMIKLGGRNQLQSGSNEFFEFFVYREALAHEKVLNITANMTFFFDSQG